MEEPKTTYKGVREAYEKRIKLVNSNSADNRRMNIFYNKRKSLGLCVSCGRKSRKGKITCKKCALIKSIIDKEYRRKKKLDSL
jgi:hypothetical protein